MKYKKDNYFTQFCDLGFHNPKLYKIGLALDNFTTIEFNKDIVLTHVFRTQEEHDALYAATPADQRPKTSPHMTWEAIDIRSTDFTPEQRLCMLQFLNSFSYDSKRSRNVAMVHAIVGGAPHFHIQCSRAP